MIILTHRSRTSQKQVNFFLPLKNCHKCHGIIQEVGEDAYYIAARELTYLATNTSYPHMGLGWGKWTFIFLCLY